MVRAQHFFFVNSSLYYPFTHPYTPTTVVRAQHFLFVNSSLYYPFTHPYKTKSSYGNLGWEGGAAAGQANKIRANAQTGREGREGGSTQRSHPTTVVVVVVIKSHAKATQQQQHEIIRTDTHAKRREEESTHQAVLQ